MLPLAFSLAPGSGTHTFQNKQGLGSSAGILLSDSGSGALLLPLGTIPGTEGGRELLVLLAEGLDGKWKGDLHPWDEVGQGKSVEPLHP